MSATTVRVVYDFEASTKGQLAVQEGEEVTIIKPDKEGWYHSSFQNHFSTASSHLSLGLRLKIHQIN